MFNVKKAIEELTRRVSALEGYESAVTPNKAYLLSRIDSLYESLCLDHGTRDGKRTCQPGRSELEQLAKNGHGCRRCIATEQLAAIMKSLKS